MNYSPVILVGANLGSLTLAQELTKLQRPFKILVDLHEEWSDWVSLGVSSFRGEAALDYFQTKFEEDQYQAVSGPQIFLKEGEWKEFGGRHKPQPLKGQEDFYCQSFIRVDPNILFTEGFKADLENHLIRGKLKSIDSCDNTDLAEPTFWKVRLTNNEVLSCEHLIFSKTPQEFFQSFSQPAGLSSSFIEFCETASAQSILEVGLKGEHAFSLEERTAFLPQSMTHEWGHFIGERTACSTPEWSFFCFLEENLASSWDEQAKKIKLLKRLLVKAFPGFDQNLKQESIKIKSLVDCSKIDDEFDYSQEKKLEKLSFVGPSSPLKSFYLKTLKCEYSSSLVAGDLRSIYSAHQALSNSLV